MNEYFAIITQNGYDLTATDVNLPHQYSGNIPIKIVKDIEKFSDYELIPFFVHSNFNYVDVVASNEAFPMEYDSVTQIAILPYEAFKKRGYLFISLALKENDGDKVIYTGTVMLDIRNSLNGENTIPTETVWVDAIVQFVNNYMNTNYEPKYNELFQNSQELQEDAEILHQTATSQQKSINLTLQETQELQESASQLVSNAEDLQETVGQQQTQIDDLVDDVTTKLENGDFNGKTILYGEGIPSKTLGDVGDAYINTLTEGLYPYYLFTKDEEDWVPRWSMRGVDGTDTLPILGTMFFPSDEETPTGYEDVEDYYIPSDIVRINGEKTLSGTIDELVTNGTTQEQINNAVSNYVDNAIEDGSIANMTIEDDSITVEKLKGLEREYQGGLNQIDYNNLIDGYKLDSTTGESVADEQYKVSNIFPVEDNKYYYASINDWDGNTHIVFYNESNEFISSVKFGQSNTGIYGEIPANSKYAKACFRNGYKPVVVFSATSVSNNSNNYIEFIQRYINNPWGNVYTNDIQQYFANNSIPIRTINGTGAKLYNVFNNMVNEDINAIVIPIQEKYYIYNMSNENISNSELKLFALMKNKDCKLTYRSFVNSMECKEFTLTDSVNIDDVICIVIDTKGLNENKLANLMISSRNDLKEYHPYGEYYFEPTDEIKKFVQSAQQDIVKQYNGGVMFTLGDSYTAYMNSFFDTFATKHGLVQDNRGLASSTIAGSEDKVTVGYHAFWVRLDEAIEEYEASGGHTIGDNSYTLDDVKLITFMGGANDWTTVDEAQGIDRLGTAESTNKEQLYGACKYIFETLLSNFPNADIVVILQPSSASKGNYIMHLKESIVRECAEMYGIPICDCCFEWYNPSNPNDASKYWQSDNLHLTSEGHQAVIDKLEKTVNNLSFTRN